MSPVEYKILQYEVEDYLDKNDFPAKPKIRYFHDYLKKINVRNVHIVIAFYHVTKKCLHTIITIIITTKRMFEVPGWQWKTDLHAHALKQRIGNYHNR